MKPVVHSPLQLGLEGIVSTPIVIPPHSTVQPRIFTLEIPIEVPCGAGIEDAHEFYVRTYDARNPYRLRTHANAPIADWLSELFNLNGMGNGKVVAAKIKHGKTLHEEAYRAYHDAVQMLNIRTEGRVVPEQTAYATQPEIRAFLNKAWYADSLMYTQPRRPKSAHHNSAARAYQSAP